MLQFPAAEFFYESPDVAAFNVIKQGDLIPVDEESYNHTARVCRIGPDVPRYLLLAVDDRTELVEVLDRNNLLAVPTVAGCAPPCRAPRKPHAGCARSVSRSST